MKTKDIEIVPEVFKEINDIVTPTMGARGRLAVINDEFSRPILTDDGVTVAKQCLNFKNFKKMIAISMIEAANNTEKEAFDGTTLTILLTYELYMRGLVWMDEGLHAQRAADKLVEHVNEAREKLKEYRMDLEDEDVWNLANITTKIPKVADLVTAAYYQSDKTMNVVIEHDRKDAKTGVEHTAGMVLDSGYMTENLKQLCNSGDRTEFERAHLVLLAEEAFTGHDIRRFFNSIPDDAVKDPFVFVISKSFNPESLKMMLDTLMENEFKFQLVFINDTRYEEIFLDLAAYTNADVQDSAFGTSEYLYENCGTVDKIVVEQDKTTISTLDIGRDRVKKRVDSYKKELKENKYTTGMTRYNEITRRLSNLEGGITKIKIGSDTVTEFMTLKLKLDDAIGAVKTAIENGIVIGCGRPLHLIASEIEPLRKPLMKPLKTIVNNAGLNDSNIRKLDPHQGLDVTTGEVVDLKEAGIIDSFNSIDNALKNAVSIASQYLRAYILIKKE